MNKYLSLSGIFLKIGLFTFGGGYAMLPLIEKDIVEKRKLISEEEMTDIIAISESTPGPLAINAATFIGYKTGGFLGALISTVSVILPSFVIVLAISYFLEEFMGVEYVTYAFNGIRIAVALLILQAGIKMFIKSTKNIIFFILLITALALTLFTSINPAFLILGGGIVGIIVSFINYKRSGER